MCKPAFFGRLGLIAPHPHEVGTAQPGVVVTLRMRCVIRQHRQRPIAVPETHQPHVWIDRSLRRFLRGCIFRRGIADDLHLAIGPQYPPIRRHFLNLAFAETNLRNFFEMTASIRRRDRHSLHGFTSIRNRKQLIRNTGLCRDLLRQEIATGCIVLMQRMYTHSVDRRVTALSNCLPERIMPLVANPNPIECHQHDRLLFICLQHNAPRRERIVHASRRRHQSIAQR